MKAIIATAIAASAVLSFAGAASAQPMHRDHMMNHHRHQVKQCSMHHHHRVCRMVWR